MPKRKFKPKLLRINLNPGKPGEAFKKCVKAVSKSGSAYSPKGVCASAGRKKYGKKMFQKLASAGNTRAATNARTLSQTKSMFFIEHWSSKYSKWLRGNVHDDLQTARSEAARGARSDMLPYRIVDSKHGRIYGTYGPKVSRNPIGPLATLTQGKAKAQVYKKLKGYEVRITRGGESKSYPASKFKGAMAIGRLRLASQNPLGADDLFSLIPGYSTADRLTSKAFTPSRKRSKNPIAAASKLYEEFHGVPSEEVLEYVEEHHHHSVTAGIGKLVSMKLTSVDGAKFEIHAPNPDGKLADVVQVTVSEDGRQLFLIGGDQSLKLKDLGMKDHDERDHMLIGTITELTYRTQKTFEDKGREVDFFHKFGNEGSKGVMPILLYNPRSKSMKIAGGRYSIAAPAKSLGNVSPGIVG